MRRRRARPDLRDGACSVAADGRRTNVSRETIGRRPGAGMTGHGAVWKPWRVAARRFVWSLFLCVADAVLAARRFVW